MLASLLGGSHLIVSTITLIFETFPRTSSLIIPLAYSHKRNPEVCKSKECIAINKNWMSKVDFAANRCDDFYKFVCGRHNDSQSEIEKNEAKITKQLIDIAKIPVLRSDHKSLRMAKEMFHRCVHNKSSIKDLKNMVTRMGGWALFEQNWKEKDFSLVKFYSKSVENGYLPNSLFTINVEMNLENRQKNMIVIRPPGQSKGSLLRKTFPTSWFSNSALNKEEHRIHLETGAIPKVAAKLGVDPKRLNHEITEFATMNLRIENMNQEPLDDHQMILKVVKLFYGNIPWDGLLNAVFHPIKISDNDTIQIECPRCLNSLNKFLYNVSKKSLASYLMGSFAFNALLDVDEELSSILTIKNDVVNLFRRVMDYEYITRKYFDESLIPKISDLIKKLKKAMQDAINNSKMMDSITKDHAIVKVKEMVFKIAYDSEIKNGQALKYYDNLELDPKSYFLSLYKVKKFMNAKYLGSLNKQPKIPYLEATAGYAWHSIDHNTVLLSLSVLTGTLYSKGNIPQYLNFGGLATVIAHEMHHAFDSDGHEVDERGQLKQWWSEEAAKNHFKALECISQQYSTFTNLETNNKVNGFLTKDENFADIGSIEVAYKVYHDLPKKGELLLQDFHYTLPQMFWISFAAVKCSQFSQDEILERENTDVHPTSRIRVNGVAINSEAFAADWECRVNSPMNPIEKCTIWK